MISSRSSRILTLALSSSLGVIRLQRAAAACEPGPLVRFTGECNVDNFNVALAALESGCTASELFGDADAADEVADLCDYDAPVQFVEIQGTYQLDRRYMNGGGPLIDSTDGFEIEAGRILRFNDNTASSALVAWPEYAALIDYNAKDLEEGEESHGYPSNFDLTKSCDLNTVMCCFIDDVNNEGFPASETTDVCHHDLANSPRSNHIKSGWSFFDGSKTATHCTGFTWTDGSDEDTYKGNALFDVSLANTVNKGYYKSIPGAPLCACIEQMPKVETAKCRTATGSNLEWIFTVDADFTVHATNEASITYGDCAAGDLAAEYKAKHENNDIDEYLVGETGCQDSQTNFLNDRFYIPGATGGSARYSSITEDDGWAFVAGEGTRFLPPDIDDEAADVNFRGLVEAGCTNADESDRLCIIRRFCDSCSSDDHVDIYYKRLTPIPPFGEEDGEIHFLDLFLNNWFNTPNNAMHVDFELYSTYEDAIGGENEWTFCNYNDATVGFPRDCGPNGHVSSQWNSYERRGTADHHGFYVEMP